MSPLSLVGGADVAVGQIVLKSFIVAPRLVPLQAFLRGSGARFQNNPIYRFSGKCQFPIARSDGERAKANQSCALRSRAWGASNTSGPNLFSDLFSRTLVAAKNNLTATRLDMVAWMGLETQVRSATIPVIPATPAIHTHAFRKCESPGVAFLHSAKFRRSNL